MTSNEYCHSLSGTVYNGMSTPQTLAGATVTVLNPDGSCSLLTDTSDFTGHYQIGSVPQGSRTIRFEKECYDTKEPTVFMANTDKEYNEQLIASLVGPPQNLSAWHDSWDSITVTWDIFTSCDVCFPCFSPELSGAYCHSSVVKVPPCTSRDQTPMSLIDIGSPDRASYSALVSDAEASCVIVSDLSTGDEISR